MTTGPKIDPQTGWTFVRFLLVGGAFSFGYSLTNALLIGKAGLPPFATTVGLYLLCIPLAYLAQKRIAFRVRTGSPRRFAVYAGTQLFCLAAIALITTRFVTRNVIIDTGIFLVTVGSAALLSFLIGKFVVFRPGASDAPRSEDPARKSD